VDAGDLRSPSCRDVDQGPVATDERYVGAERQFEEVRAAVHGDDLFAIGDGGAESCRGEHSAQAGAAGPDSFYQGPLSGTSRSFGWLA